MRNGKRRAPKSATSARAVPMADRVGGALDRRFQTSAYEADDDLVFGHPHTGRPLDRSQVSKRFKRSLQRAGVREVRFHDLTYVRNEDGRRWRPDPNAPGLDGPLRRQDDDGLHPLRARAEPATARPPEGIRGWNPRPRTGTRATATNLPGATWAEFRSV